MNELLLIVHELLCAVLFWTVFERAALCSDRVRTDVRFAFFMLGIAACAGLVAPLVWDYRPHTVGVLLLAAVVLVELVTSRYWRGGVPPAFLKPEFMPRRRSTDMEVSQ